MTDNLGSVYWERWAKVEQSNRESVELMAELGEAARETLGRMISDLIIGQRLEQAGIVVKDWGVLTESKLLAALEAMHFRRYVKLCTECHAGGFVERLSDIRDCPECGGRCDYYDLGDAK